LPTILAWWYALPALERPTKIGALGKSEQAGDLAQAQLGAAQVLAGQVVPPVSPAVPAPDPGGHQFILTRAGRVAAEIEAFLA